MDAADGRAEAPRAMRETAKAVLDPRTLSIALTIAEQYDWLPSGPRPKRVRPR